jgi:crotonobetainyl-CoA:carnitine CoA-transferase CaiB-like acyl-CoA transferase
MRRAFRPLRGVRILSFEAAFSLPSGTRTLAELGADVVQVCRPARASGDYITVVDGNALSKASLAVNLRHPEGLALARRLALQADAVCNNFRPRVMRRYGLDADALRALNPELIVLQLSGYGTPGPWQDFPAYGPSVGRPAA